MDTPQLPTELLERILWFLPVDPRSKESVRTLCLFGEANSRFLVASRMSNIWREHYEARWSYHHILRESHRLAKYGCDDFAARYRIRDRLDTKAVALLHAIMTSQDDDDRESMALTIVEDIELDVWDALWKMSDNVAVKGQDSVVHTKGLTDRYWAKELCALIARNRAIGIWSDLCSTTEDSPGSFEDALSALSAFFGYDVVQISRELDRLAQLCSKHLDARKVSNEPSLAMVAEEICTWMREYGFTRPPGDLHSDLRSRRHNALMHHFPHHVLFKDHTALPISLVYIFTSIAQRLGYNAQPVAFPYKVLAVILPHEEGGERVYVDVYDSENKAILAYSELPSMLRNMGLDLQGFTSARQYTEPAKPSLMLLRAVKNIISSLHSFMQVYDGNHITAHCATYCAASLLTGDGRLVRHLFDGSEGPLDRLVTLKHSLRPHLPLGAQEQLDDCLQSYVRPPKSFPRKEGRTSIQHYVGMLFRHKRYDYVGLIQGWDYRCEMSEEWIVRMRVDELPYGRGQPFYDTYTRDGQMRYVAEEHITPLNDVNIRDVDDIISSNKTVGRWFDGVEVYPSGRARFIQSKESKLIFPDDETVARNFADHIAAWPKSTIDERLKASHTTQWAFDITSTNGIKAQRCTVTVSITQLSNLPKIMSFQTSSPLVTAFGTWQRTDVARLHPDSPEVIVIREIDPKTDNCSSTEFDLPPPYSPNNKEYFLPEDLDLNGEPLTLARFMFKYGFLFFPFWLVGIYILCTPLIPTQQWELGKTEEEKTYLIKVLRETELKWARRCLLALYALCVLIFLSVLVIKFGILHSL